MYILLFSSSLKIQVTGDIPGERSGHATASFGRFVFLFGGINFAEESVYNDLYILNTDTWEWSYVGEKGEQIRERNSHSLDILDYGPNGKYLFLYGGASPEKGVFRDAFYARLPDTDSEIVSDMASFYVEWIKLAESARGASPGDREMHGTCVVGGNELIVLGGRNEKGDMFDDAWKLVLQTSNDSHSPETLFIWNKMESMNLPFKCCAHTLNVISSGTDGMECLCLFGGFQDRKGDVGISNDIYSYSLSPSSSSVCWKEISYEGLPVSRRFGHCSTEIYREDPKSIAVIIFGGVKEDEDLSDIWIIEDNFST